jgi:hypothetical protein
MDALSGGDWQPAAPLDLTIDVMREFSMFLRASGGFTID